MIKEIVTCDKCKRDIDISAGDGTRCFPVIRVIVPYSEKELGYVAAFDVCSDCASKFMTEFMGLNDDDIKKIQCRHNSHKDYRGTRANFSYNDPF